MNKSIIYSFLFITSFLAEAQFRFQPKFDISLVKDNQALTRAWEGGLNSPQFQTLDLNNDNSLDLVVYHRISREITTYIYNEGSYVRSPQYDAVFPDDTRSLLLLKDFDCDGKKDLFTTTARGIKVYKNTSNEQGIAWQLASDFLTYDGSANIQMSPTDIPGIADINGDGAIDILTYRFGNPQSIDLYLNTGVCGNLTFTRAERRWGDFEECGCDNFVFGQACPDAGVPVEGFDSKEAEGLSHIGGKTILVFDADNDGDMDLVTSDETCEGLYFLENQGDQSTAIMTSAVPFPFNAPVSFPFFPSAFLEDIDQDGLMDLLISTNADENIGNQIELSAHVESFTNIGNGTSSSFSTASPFLQNEMLDFGEHTFPEFVDIDQDGDQDIVLGNKGLLEPTGFSAKLILIENVGNPISPAYEVRNENYLDLLSDDFTFIKPRFADIDNDGDKDLTYLATLSFGDARLFYRENLGNQDFAEAIELTIPVNTNDNPFWYDIDNDNDLDLLLGKRFGSLSLYLNEGELNFAAEQTSFAGIIDDFQRLNLNLAVVDIDNNQVDDLITIDQSGQLRAYRGPIDLDFLATNPIDELYFIDNEPIETDFGINNYLTVADIFNNGLPSLVLGSIKGGLLFLDNLSENKGEEESLFIRMRPNPTDTKVSLLTNANGFFTIINAKGQKILESTAISSGEELEIDVSKLSKGIYVIRVRTQEGKTQSRKLIIN